MKSSLVSLAVVLVLGGGLVGATPTPGSGASPQSAEGEADPKLLAVLNAHADAWRPCHELAGQLLQNALQRSTASAQGQQDELRRLTSEGDDVKRQLSERKCNETKKRMLEDLQKTGAADPDLNQAWRAFTDSLDEQPEEPESEER